MILIVRYGHIAATLLSSALSFAVDILLHAYHLPSPPPLFSLSRLRSPGHTFLYPFHLSISRSFTEVEVLLFRRRRRFIFFFVS